MSSEQKWNLSYDMKRKSNRWGREHKKKLNEILDSVVMITVMSAHLFARRGRVSIRVDKWRGNGFKSINELLMDSKKIYLAAEFES